MEFILNLDNRLNVKMWIVCIFRWMYLYQFFFFFGCRIHK